MELIEFLTKVLHVTKTLLGSKFQGLGINEFYSLFTHSSNGGIRRVEKLSLLEKPLRLCFESLSTLEKSEFLVELIRKTDFVAFNFFTEQETKFGLDKDFVWAKIAPSMGTLALMRNHWPTHQLMPGMLLFPEIRIVSLLHFLWTHDFIPKTFENQLEMANMIFLCALSQSKVSEIPNRPETARLILEMIGVDLLKHFFFLVLDNIMMHVKDGCHAFEEPLKPYFDFLIALGKAAGIAAMETPSEYLLRNEFRGGLLITTAYERLYNELCCNRLLEL
jgi:hypothetical protein